MELRDPITGGIVNRPMPDILLSEEDKEKQEEKKIIMDARAYEKIQETIDKNVQLYTLCKEKLEGLEKNSTGYVTLSEQMEKLQVAIRDGVLFSDEKGGGETPEWLKKIHTNHDELVGVVDAAIRFNKKYQDPLHIPGFSDITKEKEKFSFLKYAMGSYYHEFKQRQGTALSSEQAWEGGEFERDLVIELARRPEFGEVYRSVSFGANDPSDDAAGLNRSAETRASLDRDARGGVLFPDGVMDLLVTPLLANSLSEQLGMMVISDLGRNKSLSVPIMESGELPAGTGWIGEGGEIAAGASKFKMRKLTPKKYAGRIAVTQEALNSVTPTQEMAWRNYLLDLFRLNALSVPIFSGTGTGAGVDPAGATGSGGLQPNGLLNDAGIPASHKIDKAPANAGIDFSLDFARQLIHEIEDANASELPNLKWVMRKTLCTIVNWSIAAQYSGQEKDDNPGYLFLNKVESGGMLDNLGGYPIVANNNVPKNLQKGTSSADLTCIGLGNWSDMYQAIWRGMSVMYNPYSTDAWTHDLIDMRVIIETDLLNTRPSAFGYITNLKRK